MARITVVNDNAEFLELMGDVLESERHAPTKIDGARPDVVDLVRASNPELLIVDLRLGSEGLRGWSVVEEIRTEPALAGLPILVDSADPLALKEVESMLEGRRPIDVLGKPFSIDELTDVVNRLLAEAVAH